MEARVGPVVDGGRRLRVDERAAADRVLALLRVGQVQSRLRAVLPPRVADLLPVPLDEDFVAAAQGVEPVGRDHRAADDVAVAQQLLPLRVHPARVVRWRHVLPSGQCGGWEATRRGLFLKFW